MAHPVLMAAVAMGLPLMRVLRVLARIGLALASARTDLKARPARTVSRDLLARRVSRDPPEPMVQTARMARPATRATRATRATLGSRGKMRAQTLKPSLLV